MKVERSAKLTDEFLRTRKLFLGEQGDCDYPDQHTYVLNEMARFHLLKSWSPRSKASVSSLPAREED